MLKTLILSLAFISFALSEEAKTPDTLKPILGTFEAETQKARQVYDAAVAKAADKAKASMDAAMKAAMKRGDLEGATAIKKTIEDLGSGSVLAGLEKKWQEAGNDLMAAPEKELSKKILGKWKLGETGITWTFTNDGKCVSSSGNTQGTWKKSSKGLNVTWSTGENVEITDKMDALTPGGKFALAVSQ